MGLRSSANDGAVSGSPLEVSNAKEVKNISCYMIFMCFDQKNKLLYDFYMIFDQKQLVLHKENNLEIKVLRKS